MSKNLDREAVDIGVWYVNNKNRIPTNNLEARLNFLEKTLDVLINIILLSTKDIKNLEGRGDVFNIPILKPTTPDKSRDWRPNIYAP